jgi:hypothetical protein
VIEILVVMTITAVAVSIFSSMVVNTTRQRVINRETAMAAEASRVLIETMRNAEFSQLFALYNQDPADDPGGAASAPGNRFAVPGLRPLPGAPRGLVGEVRFPELALVVGGAVESELREDVENPELAMPRDLDGDSLIDDEDHAGDYLLLPVLITISWDGQLGPRQFDIHVILTDFRT